MNDEDKYEQFDVLDEKTKKKKPKSKSDPVRKYRIIIIFLMLLNLFIVIMLINSKSNQKIPQENVPKNSLNFLLLSDIHDNTSSIDLILNKVKSKKYDYIFYLGDMVKMTPGQQNSSEHAHIYEERMTQYLKKLEQIAPVLYIPGNNEPYTIYEKNSPKLTKISSNIHNNYIKIYFRSWRLYSNFKWGKI